MGDPFTVNLLDYNNGDTFLLGSESLPSGVTVNIGVNTDLGDIIID